MDTTNDLDAQLAYWNREGPSKTFSHPIDWAAFESAVPRDARVVDFGCGYGRSMRELVDRGFRNVTGVDASSAMVEKARANGPDLDVRVAPPLELPFTDGGIDAVLLLAVLTCVVTNEGQRKLVRNVRRALGSGGVVYVSDLVLQDDARNVARYEQHADRYGTYGVFELSEGVVVRHHSVTWIDELFADFEILWRRTIEVPTMNGNPATVLQFLARSLRDR